MVFTIFKQYFRSDNWTKWLPMGISVFGIYASTVIGHLLSTYEVVFWVSLFACAMFSATFVVLAFNYVNKWHHIIKKIENSRVASSTMRAIIFLASFEGARKFTNNAVLVKKLAVRFIFSDKAFVMQNRIMFPFTALYEVQGKSKKQFSNLYHRIVKRGKDNGNNAEQKMNVTFFDKPDSGIVSQETSEGNVSVVRLSKRGKPISKGRAVKYTVSIPFYNSSGLSGERQRLLFCPTNISSLFSENSTIIVELIFPDDIYRDYIFELYGKSFYLRKFINDDPANDAVAGEIKVTETETVVRWDIQYGRGDMNDLFFIEFGDYNS